MLTLTPKTGILLAAYGTSNSQSEASILEFTSKVKETFPNIPIRWAFTSPHIINRLAKQKIKSDSINKALLKMYYEKFTHIAVQSLNLIKGIEYENMLEDIASIKETTKISITAGLPLLSTEDSINKAAKALLKHIPTERNPTDAVICMGHGTWHQEASAYSNFQKIISKYDPFIYIGTLKGEQTITDIIPKLKVNNIKRVWLMPLLSLIGNHAKNDMAGDSEDSWLSLLTKAKLESNLVMKGTVEYESFSSIWLEHLEQALNSRN